MGVGRFLAILGAINVALLLIGHVVGPRPASHAGKGLRIGLVFDVGGRGDKSFNDAAWRGLERARNELGVRIETIEPGEGAARESALRQLASGGADLVIGVGFIFSRDLDRLAAQFPDVKFAGIDYAPPDDGKLAPNLAGIRFREHEGSFLVGAAAGMSTRTSIVGFVGGMRIPLIRKFEAGYIAGVHAVCPRCKVLSAYAGTEAKAFADPTLGHELAATQLNRGADVVFHAAGKTGSGVIAAVAERGKLAIGVDSDQHDEAPCCVLTSMLKRVDVGVFDAVNDLVEGRFQGGLRELGLAEDGVGFVANADNARLLLAPVVERMRALSIELIAGRIEVPTQ